MKTLLTATFVAVFSFASHSANAQEYAGQRYVGISIGQIKNDYCDFVRFDTNDDALSFTRTCPDTDDDGIKFYVGHNLHKNFAVEAGFIDFGEFKPNLATTRYATFDGDNFSAGDVLASNSLPAKTSGNSLFVAGIWKIHVHPKVALFGKVGLHRWDIEFKIKSARFGIDFDTDDNGVDLFYGIGGEVAPFPNNKIKLRMEYEMFPTEAFGLPDADERNAFDFESFSIGITYAF